MYDYEGGEKEVAYRFQYFHCKDTLLEFLGKDFYNKDHMEQERFLLAGH